MASKAWQEIVSTALSVEQECRKGGNRAWFRGERNSSWNLKATLHRHLDDKFKGSKLTPPEELKWKTRLLHEEGKSLYLSFKAEAWPLLDETERSDWGLLFAMQHFSLPTRLLDWTESFACAVYFAQSGRAPEDTAAIWLLEPAQLNNYACGVDAMISLDDKDRPARLSALKWHPGTVRDVDPLASIAVMPFYTNPRMVQQQSRFTIMGDSFLPLNEQFDGQLVRNGHLKKLLLTPETFKDAEDFLSLCGQNAYSFFPDLQGLGMKHKATAERDRRFAKEVFPGFYKRD